MHISPLVLNKYVVVVVVVVVVAAVAAAWGTIPVYVLKSCTAVQPSPCILSSARPHTGRHTVLPKHSKRVKLTAMYESTAS